MIRKCLDMSTKNRKGRPGKAASSKAASSESESPGTLQEHLLKWPILLNGTTPGNIFDGIRSILLRAVLDSRLQVAPDVIHASVWLDSSQAGKGKWKIEGGDRNVSRSENREPRHAKLLRVDGAWIHFAFTLSGHRTGPVELDSYAFELVLPQDREPWFVRLDLNPKDHANDADRDCRSHCHPGDDDMMIPAPVMSPAEILDLLLYKAVLPAQRKRRSTRA